MTKVVYLIVIVCIRVCVRLGDIIHATSIMKISYVNHANIHPPQIFGILSEGGSNSHYLVEALLVLMEGRGLIL